MCQTLIQTSKTATCAVFSYNKLLPCNRCIWGISPSKLWPKMFWIMAFSVVLEKRWSLNNLRIQWCWGWLGCWRSADVQLASYKVWQSAKEGFHLLNCEQRLMWVNDSIQTVYTEAILCIHYIFLSHMLTTVRTLQGQYWQPKRQSSVSRVNVKGAMCILWMYDHFWKVYPHYLLCKRWWLGLKRVFTYTKHILHFIRLSRFSWTLHCIL